MTKFQIGDRVRWKTRPGDKPFVLDGLFSVHYLRQLELIGRHGFKIGDRVNLRICPEQEAPGRIIGFEDPGMLRVCWNCGPSTHPSTLLRHEPWPADPVLAAGLKAIVDFLGGRVQVRRMYWGPSARPFLFTEFPELKVQTPYAKWAAGRGSVDPERAFIAGWNAAERNARQVANRDAETLKRIAALIRERS